jgi:hypothetical protein
MVGRSTLLLSAALALAVASPLAGQGKFGDRARAGSDVEARQALSVSPFGALIGIYAAEYERALFGGFSAGIGASRWNLEDGDWTLTFVDLMSRFYPGGQALQGFSVGAQIGHFRERDSYYDGDLEYSGISFGGDVGYSRVLGRMYLGVGAGLRIADEEPFPTGRLAVGFAF